MLSTIVASATIRYLGKKYYPYNPVARFISLAEKQKWSIIIRPMNRMCDLITMRDYVGRNWLRLTSALTRSIFDVDIINDMPHPSPVGKLHLRCHHVKDHRWNLIAFLLFAAIEKWCTNTDVWFWHDANARAFEIWWRYKETENYNLD